MQNHLISRKFIKEMFNETTFCKALNWFHVILEMNLKITGCSWYFVDFTEFWLKNIFRVNFNAVLYFHSFYSTQFFIIFNITKRTILRQNAVRQYFMFKREQGLKNRAKNDIYLLFFFHQKDSNMHEEHPWITTVQFILCLFSFSHSTYSDSNLYSPFFKNVSWTNVGLILARIVI